MLSWGKDGLYEEWMIRWEPEVIYGMATDDSFLQDLQQQIHCNATLCKSCNSRFIAMPPSARVAIVKPSQCCQRRCVRAHLSIVHTAHSSRWMKLDRIPPTSLAKLTSIQLFKWSRPQLSIFHSIFHIFIDLVLVEILICLRWRWWERWLGWP